jgi:catalase
MTTKKTSSKTSPRPTSRSTRGASHDSARTTVSGPSKGGDSEADRDLAAYKMSGAQGLAAAFPSNQGKASEHGAAARKPPRGQHVVGTPPVITGSTLTEVQSSTKVGRGNPQFSFNPGNASLDRVRVDSSERPLTTNQGVPVADNQNSLKAGLRSAVLLEDFILREKLTHFDHERIPERVVHARGSGAHGYFECTESLADITRASVFAEVGKRTPVFARFSTVAGERGSTDLARDVRGFAVKLYTDEGNWDLVGNNIPVFFIQDAIKFPDLVHALKPEPHHQMPQAASAHDTFWDFVSLMPESTHMLLWLMSDRAIPRSYRMMQGFGVHTFRFVDAAGTSRFVKFHWLPTAGTHSLVWDEAVKLSGADPDFHRRDLWEAIEMGAFPEWDLAVQVFTEKDAARFDFDVLDATKIVPEELVPLRIVGRMVLDRNPDNFFAETEQVAFCTAHVVPGIDFTEDPLLAGRIHSYVDTQLTRLGGPNFHEIPINASVAQVHNNQRDGLHRQAIPRGRVAYEPSSLSGGCPFQAGARGFTSAEIPSEGLKVRGKPELFAEHYRQATLFWNSQTPHERAHILGAFRFELTKVQTPAIRTRLVSMLRNVTDELAIPLAEQLGIDLPAPMPKAMTLDTPPLVDVSPALSLAHRPGNAGIVTRKVAILVADGIDGEMANAFHEALRLLGAVPRFVGERLGRAVATGSDPIEVEVTLETMPSVTWDAAVIPDGHEATELFAQSGHVAELIECHYRHCKPLLTVGTARSLLGAVLDDPSDADATEPQTDGLLTFEADAADDALESLVAAMTQHRHYARETDPPIV